MAPNPPATKACALAVAGKQRSAAFPEVPTLREQGLPEREVETWYGAFAPAGTPSLVLARINTDLNAILLELPIREILAKQGMTPVGGAPQTLSARVGIELARWKQVVKKAGVKPE